MRFFKRNDFCLEIRFSQDQHAISDFRFFKDRCFFYATSFKNLFSLEPLSIFSGNETFRGHEGQLKVFSTMQLTGDQQKNLRNISIFFNFRFFLCFPLRKIGFLLFTVGEEWFSRLTRITSGIFWNN